MRSSVIALIGVAGTGKTTLLRRMGLDVCREGFLVLRLRDDWLMTRSRLSRQIGDVARESASPLLVLIDNAANLVFDLNVLEGTLCELEVPQPVVLAMAEQPDRWNAAIKSVPSLMEGENYFPHRIHHLLRAECETLVDRILQYERDGTLTQSYTDLPREERLKLCLTSAERQLLVAMLQIRHGTQFLKIIEREYERVPTKEGKTAYALVCYFNKYEISLPLDLILRALRIHEPRSVQQLREYTEGLFTEDGLGLRARHSRIGRTVARYAMSSPEAKKAALSLVLLALNPGETNESEAVEEMIFKRFFSGRNVYRRLVGDLDRKGDLIRPLFSEIRAAQRSVPPYLFRLIATSEGLAERMLRNNDRARAKFEEAIRLDPRYVFAYRQYAWLEHGEGNWQKAGELAVKATDLAPNNFLANYHCSRILSLSTTNNFRRAKPYFKRALEIDPSHRRLIKDWEDYQTAERILKYFSQLKADQLLPESVYQEMRPGLAFIRAVRGPSSKGFRQRLIGDLRHMEEQAVGELGDLYEMIAGIEIGKNRILNALITCNEARLRYLTWYHRGDPCDPGELEQLFKTSLQFNDKDPFTRCWYGTFLKEVRKDFHSARSEYDNALKLGDQSGKPWLQRHPLFLNNLALLIMDEVQQGLRPKDFLQDARLLLEEAVTRVKETESDFFWPVESLSLCKELMQESDTASSD